VLRPNAMGAEDDILSATPPALVRVAGGLVLFAGAMAVLTGGQVFLVAVMRGPLAAVPYLLVGAGALDAFFGLMVFRARDWAAIGAVAVSGILMLLAFGWLVVSFGGGLFQMYAMISPFAAAAALAMSIASLGPCRRATAARERLAAQGMNLGI
jgi:hypothetical protein